MVRRKVLLAAAIAAATTACTRESSLALQSSRISDNVRSALAKSADAKIPVLVFVKGKADLRGAEEITDRVERLTYVYQKLVEVAKSTQTGVTTFLDSENLVYRRFYATNMISVSGISQAQIDALAARSDVEKIMGNPEVNGLPPVDLSINDFAPPSLDGVEPGIVATGATKVWDEFSAKGEGILIAGQDTGVQWDHPALKSHYRGFSDGETTHTYSWHDAIHEGASEGNTCGYDTETPCDDHGHGTHTIGTVVGDDGDSNKIGMAPGAQWIACRNMDAGIGTPATYIECFEWFLAPYPQNGNPMVDGRPELAPHVINNSWGCPPEEGCHGDEMVQVLEALSAAGVMVVASAGNEGPGCGTIGSPAAYHSALTFSVGAYSHTSGNIASFSSRGPSAFDGELGPDISAPGVSIRSAVPGGGYQGGWSGTSMAGPHVVGAVALLWSAKASLVGDIASTTTLLRASATGKTTTQTCGDVSGDQIPNNTFGYGLLDIYKAVSDSAL